MPTPLPPESSFVSKATNDELNPAMERLRARIGPTAEVTLRPVGDALYVYAIDGSDRELVPEPPAPPEDATDAAFNPVVDTSTGGKPSVSAEQVSRATERLRARVGADAEVRIATRNGNTLVVATLDGKEFEVVMPPAAAPSEDATVSTDADPGDEAPPPAPPKPIGMTGYDRILELLNKPPVDAPGLPPPSTGVPTDLTEWLDEFKIPLATMTVETAISALQARIGGYSRGRLKELYAQMTPAEIAAVMNGNAAVVQKFVDQKALEAAMIASTMNRVTELSASFLLHALSLI